MGTLLSKDSLIRHAGRWGLVALVVLVLFGPLFPLFHTDAFFVDRPTTVPETEFAWRALGVSLVVAAMAAGLAVVVGTCLAAVLTLDRPYGGSLWSMLSLVPFVIPPTVWALGQVSFWGPGGTVERFLGDSIRPWLNFLNPGHAISTGLVLAQIHVPLAMLIVGRGIARLPHMGWEAARFQLRRAALARWLARALGNDLVAAFLIINSLSLGNFAVPHVLQCRTYAVEIYFRLVNYLDQSGAIQAARPLLVIALASSAMALFLEQRQPSPVADSRTGRHRSLGIPLWARLAGVVYLVFTVILPLLSLVGLCGSWSVFLTVAREAAPETENTLIIAVASATLASLFGVAAISESPWERRPRTVLNLFMAADFAIPGLLIGVAFARGVGTVGSIAVGNVVLIWALAVRGWPFVSKMVDRGQASFSPSWRDAARVSGVGMLRRFRWLVVPWFTEDVAAGTLVSYTLACGEVEISQLLCAPGGGTLALRLFTFLHFGPASVVASLAVLQLILVLVPFGVYLLLSHRPVRIK